MKCPGSTVQRTAFLMATLLSSLASVSAWADDIDVYAAAAQANQKPNILFVLDYSGSMGWGVPGTSDSRIKVLKEAMNQVLDKNVDNINAGLGSIFSTSPTGIRWPVSDLSADANTFDSDITAGNFTVKDIIKKRIAERGAGGSTATVDALVEAAQYFAGDPVTHNDRSASVSSTHQPATWNSATEQYTGGNRDASLPNTYSPSDAYSASLRNKTFYCNDYTGSGGPNYCAGKRRVRNCTTMTANDPATPAFERLNNLWGDYKRCDFRRRSNWETPRYNSPIVDGCGEQTNAIVLITDGEPTSRTTGNSLNNVVPNRNFRRCRDLTRLFARSPYTSNQGNCAFEIVSGLYGQNVAPLIPGRSVKTYTVGFNITGPGQDFLNLLSSASETEAYEAQKPEELTQVLDAIITDAMDASENFAELSVEVDRASFAHSDRVFYNLFSPSIKRAWQGNFKGYFVEPDGLYGVNGLKATTDGDNTFNADVQSFWSPLPDGNQVDIGGASAKLKDAQRNLYTYAGDTLNQGAVNLANNEDTELLSENELITNAMLGLSEDDEATADRTVALDWIQDAPMGDPLHTKSVGVNYDDGNNNIRKIRYLMTNQGLLHAFDTTNPVEKSIDASERDLTGGDELFAFMPQRLLKNLPGLTINTVGEGHIYGLDGAMTRWHDDRDNNGVVNGNEKVTLYFGMRRGGTAYYSMDVSNYNAPKLNWVIDETTENFEQLAQSWSRMSLIRVKDSRSSDGERRVLVFGGGYDALAQDDVDSPVASKGNAIYMVSEQGDYLWSVDENDNDQMKFSIASDVTVIDSDNDTLADRLYVGDLGGQVWRVDFGDISQRAAVTRLANLGEGSHQPFFYPPSVSMNGAPGNRFLAITLGSGNRTNPLADDTLNNFYMIRDTDVKAGGPEQSPYPTVGAADLYDATDNKIQSSVDSIARTARNQLEASRGWRVQLELGEKSLSSILAYGGKVMATTFTPAVIDDETVCGADPSNYYYVMDVTDASVINPALGSQTQAGVSRKESRTSVNSKGIASGPEAVLTKNGSSGQIFVDKETLETFDRSLTQVFWHEK